MQNSNFIMLTKVYPEWERQFENLETEKRKLWNEFSKQNKIDLTFYDYQNLSFERGGIIKDEDASKLKKFDESKNGKSLKMFNEQNKKFMDEITTLTLLTALSNECITSNNTKALLTILKDIEIANKNISNSNVFDSKYKSKFLLLFDAISEKYNFLVQYVSKIFMYMEFNLNVKLKEFDFLFRNQSDFNKTFSALKDYWDGNQNLYQYATFFNNFLIFCKALANINPNHNKECLEFLNQCHEIHKSAHEKYLCVNTQSQQNDKPQMETGPKEPEIG